MWVNIAWQFVRQITCAAKNRYYNANRVTSHIHSLLSYKRVPPTELNSKEKGSAASRDESQVYALKMGDLLQTAIDFFTIDHWITLAIGLFVLLIYRYVCTMQQNVSSKTILETPPWVLKKRQIVLSFTSNCIVFCAHNPIPGGYLSSLQLGLSWGWVWSGMALSLKIPKKYAFRGSFGFFTYFWRSWYCCHLCHV